MLSSRVFLLAGLIVASAAYAKLDIYEPTPYPPRDAEQPSLPSASGGMSLEQRLERWDMQFDDWTRIADIKSRSLKGDVEALKQKVDALERAVAALQSQKPGGTPAPAANDPRIAALEARVAQLEKERGVYQAPFVVKNAAGKAILQVQPDGVMHLASASGTNQITFLARGGEPTRVVVQGGTAAAQLQAGAGGGVLELVDNKSTETRLTASSGELGLAVIKDGQLAAGLGAPAGKSVALRLYDKSGRTIAAAGENPRVGGTGIVYVGNGSQNSASLAADAEGSGIVHAFAADGTVGSGLSGGERLVAAYNKAGNAVVTIGKSENSEGGNVTARDPAGDGVFRAGHNSAVGGGDACVYRAKRQNVFCLGIGMPGVGTR